MTVTKKTRARPMETEGELLTAEAENLTLVAVETVTETTGNIVDAVREGFESGARAADSLWSGVRHAASDALYGGAYFAAYGVTFGVLFVGHLIPRDSSLGRGLRDGAKRAASDAEVWEHGRASEPREADTA